MFKKQRHYLDWAAATPLSSEARRAVEPWLECGFGNPSAIHQEGATARRALEEARTATARALGVRPGEVFFTGSGTEANNLAIQGFLGQLGTSGQSLKECEVITTAIEHPSVTNVLAQLQQQGLVVHQAPLDETGVIDIASFTELLNERTVLVTCSYVNSEVGIIQPIKRISRAIRQSNRERTIATKLHVDAAQAPLWLSCDVHQQGADLLTLDAGKFCGPKGIGLLVKLSGVELQTLLHGGGQESGLRSGTENVAGIVGAATALVSAQADWSSRSAAVAAVRDAALAHIATELPQALINGPVEDARVCNNINLSFPGLDTEYLTVWLDTQGFAVSTRSACSGAGGGESQVVEAIYQDKSRSRSTLRITLGPDTTLKRIKEMVAKIKEHLQTMSELTQN